MEHTGVTKELIEKVKASEDKDRARLTINLLECQKNNPWTKAHRNVTHQLALLVGAKDAALRLRKEAAEGDDWAGTEEERRVALNTIVK